MRRARVWSSDSTRPKKSQLHYIGLQVERCWVILKRPFCEIIGTIMSSNLSTSSSFSKLSALLFARPRTVVGAERHKTLREAFKAWRALRTAENELYSLSDRDLADIGLTRQEIPNAVRGRSYR